ncbi:GMC oxidoreductase [Myxosarcina sp. GI1]|uniref:GMC oxidoreductase n=1 Tax=Myxosarcina sp. GI1 TaxID=1541065 RepID=UPI000567E8B4|nr:GMC family oxidoreductase [Myxosarcina sp. GI1]
MIIDARSLSLDKIIEADICIVGAGVAGITLAREFINQNVRVCLVESGGMESAPDTQSLCEGKIIGDRYPDLKKGRRRQFGGTSHAWEAPVGYKKFGWRCIPLDEIDFEQRDWLPYSGWPFTKSHLDSFYQRAHQVCQLGPFTYRVEDWEGSAGRRLPLNSDRLMTTMSQYASRNPFTQEYREEIGRTENIMTLLHATVIEIETDEAAHTVTRLRAACIGGKQFWLSAKVFILATGGIENARLLLLSSQRQQAGLGNQHDLVGRYFMERPIVSCGMLIPYSRKLFDRTGLYDVVSVKGVPVMARVRLTDEIMRREQLLNNGAQLFPRPQPRQKASTQALRSLLKSMGRAELSQDILKSLITVIRGGDYIAAAAFWSAIRQLPGLRRGDWSYLPYEKQRFSMFEVIYQIEQAPNPNNRVVLTSDRDFLGQNKAEIHWRLNDIDLRTVERVREIWVEEFAKAKLGDFKLSTSQGKLNFEQPAMYHHMGTTRMHDNPQKGVVDADCRVHGMTNLFIAGSSVFPTSGYANPTLTIIALAIRLAEKIKILMT